MRTLLALLTLLALVLMTAAALADDERCHTLPVCSPQVLKPPGGPPVNPSYMRGNITKSVSCVRDLPPRDYEDSAWTDGNYYFSGAEVSEAARGCIYTRYWTIFDCNQTRQGAPIGYCYQRNGWKQGDVVEEDRVEVPNVQYQEPGIATLMPCTCAPEGARKTSGKGPAK